MKGQSKEACTADVMMSEINLLDEPEEREVQEKPVAVVEWEDITAYSRVELPEDFEIFRLSKITVGLLWKEAEDYIVLVQDYDLTNRGKGYRHNDFHIIPRGAIKRVSVLGDVSF
ncbi:MAG: hypothetical protein M1548_00860 [Actinobacteria bacterium]|nr:hypothetical protein [Actinomycetota bacterium]